MSTMLNFNRLSRLTKDVNAIADALRHSSLIEVNDEKTKIRRNPDRQLPENSLEYWQKIKHRTVYVKGFPADVQLDQLQTFFNRFGKVENIVMRRLKGAERLFKGSVFVTYASRDDGLAFVANDVNKFEQVDLIKMMQDDYWLSKQQQNKTRKLEAKQAKSAKQQEDKSLKEKEQKEPEEMKYTKGQVLEISGLPTDKQLSMKMIKDHFKKFGDVAYVVYEDNGDKAQLRFDGAENSAGSAWSKAQELGSDGVVHLLDTAISGRVLEGDEEEQYWLEVSKSRANKKQRMAAGGRGGGRGRGGRDSGRGRGRGRRGGRGGGGRGGHKRSADDGDDAETKKARHTVFQDNE